MIIYKEQIRGRKDCLTKHLEARKILVCGDLKIPKLMPVFSCVVLMIRFHVKGLLYGAL